MTVTNYYNKTFQNLPAYMPHNSTKQSTCQTNFVNFYMPLEVFF